MDIKQIVLDLCALSDEQEWFEFKENWFQPEALGEYVSALSNAAAFHYKKQQNFSLCRKMILGRLRDQKTPETRINSMFLRVLGVSFIACVSGAFSVNGAQMVPKSHAGL